MRRRKDKATEKQQEIESKKVDCVPIPQDHEDLLKQHQIPAVYCGEEKMLETLNNFVSHYENAVIASLKSGCSLIFFSVAGLVS